MQLTVHQAASYLGVNEATVRRWITQRGLPAHRVNERLHLNAIELWEWATENGIAVSRRLLDQARRRPDDVAPLSELLAVGGIHHDVGGEGKTDVLREIVARLPLPADTDRAVSRHGARGARSDGVHGDRRRDRDSPRAQPDRAARRGAVRDAVPAARTRWNSTRWTASRSTRCSP